MEGPDWCKPFEVARLDGADEHIDRKERTLRSRVVLLHQRSTCARLIDRSGQKVVSLGEPPKSKGEDEMDAHLSIATEQVESRTHRLQEGTWYSVK